jgi:hypothetical protein
MWQTDSLITLRTIIADFDEPYTYSDSRMTSVFLLASRFVNSDLFGDSYNIILNSGILPDPTTQSPPDYAFLNLACVRAAYFITLGESKISASQGIAIRDGSSSLDLKGVSEYKSRSAQTYLDLYNDMKYDYQVNGGPNGPPGCAIMSPITTYLNQYPNYLRRIG